VVSTRSLARIPRVFTLLLLCFLVAQALPLGAKKDGCPPGSADWVFDEAGDPMSTCRTGREVRTFLMESEQNPDCDWHWWWNWYAVWKDTRLGPDGDLFAQKRKEYSKNLRWRWLWDGVAVTNASVPIERWGAVLDGRGGMVIVYVSGEPPEQDVLAQRLSSSGRRMWDPPVTLAGGTGPQRVDFVWRFVVPDGSGGAIAAWEDCTAGPDCDIRAGRIALDGSQPWGAGGVPVVAAPGRQFSPLVVEDGTGGVLVSWTDEATGEIRAQRMGADGHPQWAPEGVVLGAGERATDIATDGVGGALVAFTGTCNEKDVFVRRVAADGSLPWGGPAQVTCASGWQWMPRLAPDGEGGAYVTWNEDPAHPGPSPTSPDVYAQWVDGAGAARWAAGGVAVSEEPGEQRLPMIAASWLERATLTWADFRPPGGIYVQEVADDGSLVLPAPELISTDMADTDHDGLTLINSHGLPWEAFRTNRCGPEQIWFQYLPISGPIHDPFPFWDCAEFDPVCSDGEVVGCSDCDGLLSAIEDHGLPEGTENSLLSKAEAACAALDRGQPDTAGNILCAFLHELDAQDGKHVPEATAEDLRACVETFAEAAGAPLPCEEE